MVFEEFFKKKKIDLAVLQNHEPGLFAEFKIHFEQMGEKSFDHTKKYWFNPLRRKYPAPVEPKVEKVIIENPIAEQTIIDALTEPAVTSTSTGFKPRFKAGMTTKPAEEIIKPEQTPAPVDETPAQVAPNPISFKPRFKANMVTKPVEETVIPEGTPSPVDEKPADEAAKPVGFKPRFKASMITKPAEQPAKSEETAAPFEEGSTEETLKPVGFKPRFKPKS